MPNENVQRFDSLEEAIYAQYKYIIEERLSNEEVAGDEVHARGNISEDGDKFNEREASRAPGTVLQRRNRVDTVGRRTLQTERSGYRTVEERPIQGITGTDGFRKLSTTVVNEVILKVFDAIQNPDAIIYNKEKANGMDNDIIRFGKRINGYAIYATFVRVPDNALVSQSFCLVNKKNPSKTSKYINNNIDALTSETFLGTDSTTTIPQTPPVVNPDAVELPLPTAEAQVQESTPANTNTSTPENTKPGISESSLISLEGDEPRETTADSLAGWMNDKKAEMDEKENRNFSEHAEQIQKFLSKHLFKSYIISEKFHRHKMFKYS